VKGIPCVELEKQMLANRVRARDGMPIQQPRIAESALRARYLAHLPREMASELTSDSMDGVTLGHD